MSGSKTHRLVVLKRCTRIKNYNNMIASQRRIIVVSRLLASPFDLVGSVHQNRNSLSHCDFCRINDIKRRIILNGRDEAMVLIRNSFDFISSGR